MKCSGVEPTIQNSLHAARIGQRCRLIPSFIPLFNFSEPIPGITGLNKVVVRLKKLHFLYYVNYELMQVRHLAWCPAQSQNNKVLNELRRYFYLVQAVHFMDEKTKTPKGDATCLCPTSHSCQRQSQVCVV